MKLAGLKKQLGHEASPLVQFIKYGIAGGAATATNIIVFFLLGWLVLPCLTDADPLVKLLGLQVPEITESARVWRAGICNTIGFVVSNLFCYLLNRLFVFKPGRHVWFVEMLLFLAGSGISFVIGLGLQTILIRCGVQTTPAFAANIVVAVLLNYVTRKFFIFKG